MNCIAAESVLKIGLNVTFRPACSSHRQETVYNLEFPTTFTSHTVCCCFDDNANLIRCHNPNGNDSPMLKERLWEIKKHWKLKEEHKEQ